MGGAVIRMPPRPILPGKKRLPGTILPDTKLPGIMLHDTILSGPMLTGPLLTGPMLTDPMLTGPMLTGTMLPGTLLIGAMLSGCCTVACFISISVKILPATTMRQHRTIQIPYSFMIPLYTHLCGLKIDLTKNMK